MRTPFFAPTPVPTITAVGVAKPRAHGQATTVTATAASRANRNGSEAVLPGCGLAKAPSQLGRGSWERRANLATVRTVFRFGRARKQKRGGKWERRRG